MVCYIKLHHTFPLFLHLQYIPVSTNWRQKQRCKIYHKYVTNVKPGENSPLELEMCKDAEICANVQQDVCNEWVQMCKGARGVQVARCLWMRQGASVQLLPRPPPERPPLSSQWSRRCCRQSREDTAGENSDTSDTVSRRRHSGWRHSRKKQDVGHRETGTHETQSELRGRMGRSSRRICRRRWAVVESHGQPRLLEALVTPPHPHPTPKITRPPSAFPPGA